MALTRTSAQLRSEIRNRGEIRTVYVGDTELDRMIDVGYMDFYNFLIETNPDWFLKSANISVVAGTSTYDLDTDVTDFFKLIGVDALEGNYYYKLEPFNFASRNEYQRTNLNPRSLRYRIMGSKLYLSPTPDSSFTLRMWYVPAPTLPSSSGTLDGYGGWEEYVILHVLIQYAAKEESDATLFAAQLNALKEQIRSNASSRDDGEPDRVRDAWSENYVYSLRRGYPKLGLP